MIGEKRHEKVFSDLCIVMVLSLVACGGDTAETTDSPDTSETTTDTTDTADTGDDAAEDADTAEETDEELVIAGINLQEDQFSSWCAMGYEDACKDYGVKFLHGISGGDAAKEIELLNTYATQGVDGIAIMPASETTSVEVIKQIYENYDIPISLLNAEMNDTYKDFIVACVTTAHDDLARPSGQAAAEYIKNELGGQAKIGIITFKSQYVEPATKRMEGFLEEVKAVNPDVEVVAEAEAWVQDMAIQAAGDMITANPDLDVIFACNDGGTVGPVMAVKNANKAGQIKVFGIDGGEQQLDMLRSDDNILQAVTAQDAYGMGYQTMESLILYLRGEYTPTGEDTLLPGTLLERGDDAAIDAYEELLASTKG